MSLLSTFLAVAMADTNTMIIVLFSSVIVLFVVWNIISAPIAVGRSVFNLLTTTVVLVILAAVALLYVADKYEKSEVGDMFESIGNGYFAVSERLYTFLENGISLVIKL